MKTVRNYMLFLLFFLTNIIVSQKLSFNEKIGKFENARAFSISPAGILYVSDSDKNEITKLDTLGNVIRNIGGYGWQSSSFDDPCDIFANTLNVYVADKNNDRIQLFDKDLNFLSSLKNDEGSSNSSFRYPTGIAVSNQGDLYVLDSDNSRILKYNLRGDFLFQIGSYDSGTYALSNPIKFTITEDQKIIVLENKSLFIFDQFGNGSAKIPLDFKPININSTFQNITLTDGKNVYYLMSSSSINETPFEIFKPESESDITDVLIFNSKLYVLTPTEILIYQFL